MIRFGETAGGLIRFGPATRARPHGTVTFRFTGYDEPMTVTDVHGGRRPTVRGFPRYGIPGVLADSRPVSPASLLPLHRDLLDIAGGV